MKSRISTPVDTIIRYAWALCLFALSSQLFSGCFQFRLDEIEVDRYFRSQSIKPEFNHYQIEDRRIFYAATGKDSARMVIFIHGSPGSWTNFINFLGNRELTKKFRLVSVERTGFGHSDFGYPEASLEEQARLLKPVLKQNRSEKLPIIIGHSLGGPIAAKMALMYPDMIDAIILVAPSIDPSLEPNEPWRKYLRWPIIKKLIPIAVKVSNEEIFFLKEQLIDMLPAWKNIRKPVVVIQGGDDFLVDPGNAEFAGKVLINSDLRIMYHEEADHFIPWTSPELLEKAIFEVTQ